MLATKPTILKSTGLGRLDSSFSTKPRSVRALLSDVRLTTFLAIASCYLLASFLLRIALFTLSGEFDGSPIVLLPPILLPGSMQ